MRFSEAQDCFTNTTFIYECYLTSLATTNSAWEEEDIGHRRIVSILEWKQGRGKGGDKDLFYSLQGSRENHPGLAWSHSILRSIASRITTPAVRGREGRNRLAIGHRVWRLNLWKKNPGSGCTFTHFQACLGKADLGVCLRLLFSSLISAKPGLVPLVKGHGETQLLLTHSVCHRNTLPFVMNKKCCPP